MKNSAQLGKAHAHYRKRRFSQSHTIIREVLDNKPSVDTNVLALVLVGKISFHEGRYADAIEALESSNAAIDLMPETFVSSSSTISDLIQSNNELIKSAKLKLEIRRHGST